MAEIIRECRQSARSLLRTPLWTVALILTIAIVIAGIVAGTLGSVLVAQLISRITPADERLSPWIWVAAPVTLALAVTIASVLPARRALASDPLVIMKDDL